MDLKGHFWNGVDDAVIEALQSARSGSAWLAKAIGEFVEVIGPELLGEVVKGDLVKQARAYNVELPRWASAYIARLPHGYRTRFVRSAAWFYLGRLSNSFDIDDLVYKLMQVVGDRSQEPLTDVEKTAVEEFVNQF